MHRIGLDIFLQKTLAWQFDDKHAIRFRGESTQTASSSTHLIFLRSLVSRKLANFLLKSILCPTNSLFSDELLDGLCTLQDIAVRSRSSNQRFLRVLGIGRFFISDYFGYFEFSNLIQRPLHCSILFWRNLQTEQKVPPAIPEDPSWKQRLKSPSPRNQRARPAKLPRNPYCFFPSRDGTGSLFPPDFGPCPRGWSSLGFICRPNIIRLGGACQCVRCIVRG